jgi:hypothetical protein
VASEAQTNGTLMRQGQDYGVDGPEVTNKMNATTPSAHCVELHCHAEESHFATCPGFFLQIAVTVCHCYVPRHEFNMDDSFHIQTPELFQQINNFKFLGSQSFFFFKSEMVHPHIIACHYGFHELNSFF